MEWATGLLSSLLRYGPRQGWLLLIGGASVVALDYFEPIPAASLPGPWPTIALIAAVIGAVILLICAVEWMRAGAGSNARKQTTARETAAKIDSYRQDALQNLDVLDEEELEALLWILRAGKQRFAGRLDYTAAANLANKCIIGRGSAHSDNIWMVIDVVWNRRDELIQKHRNVAHLAHAPWSLGL